MKFLLKMIVNMQDCYGENRRVDTRGQLAVLLKYPACVHVFTYTFYVRKSPVSFKG